MENCLITKLNGSIDENILPKLNMIRISTELSSGDWSYAQRKIQIKAAKAFKIVCRDGVAGLSFTNPDTNLQTELSFNANDIREVSFKNAKFICDIDDKTAVTYLVNSSNSAIESVRTSFYSVNLDELRYATSIDTLFLMNTLSIGSIECLTSLPLLFRLYIHNTEIIGEINVLAAGLASLKGSGDRLEIICNKYITLNGSIVGNGVTKTVTFDG